MYSDIISGTHSKRPGLDAALDYLRSDDTLVVTRPDRLGRSTLGTIKVMESLTSRNIRLEILDLGLDSETTEGRLVIRIMSALAEHELELIRERTRVGLDYARKNGRYGGRPPALSPTAKDAALAALADGMTEQVVTDLHGVSRSTITRLHQASRSQLFKED